MLIAAPTAFCTAEAQTQPASRWEGTNVGGLHFFGPTRASAAIGVGLRRRSPYPEERSRLLFAMFEPGFGALRLSAGYAESIGSMASGWSLRASAMQLMRVEGKPRYLGGEIQAIVIACLGSRLGAFRSLETGARKETLWIADFSICL